MHSKAISAEQTEWGDDSYEKRLKVLISSNVYTTDKKRLTDILGDYARDANSAQRRHWEGSFG